MVVGRGANLLGEWYDIAIAVFGAILGSSGLWAYVTARRSRDTHRDKLLKGLSHLVIMDRANEYIERGVVGSEEFAILYNLVYANYKELGGNGAAERLMHELERLPSKKED